MATLNKDLVKLGIAPIGWTNDDMPELGAENTFQQTISEMALAGFKGSEVGGHYPTDKYELKKALDLRDMVICNQWFSSFLLAKPYEEVEKEFVKQCDFLHYVGARVIGASEQSYSIAAVEQTVRLETDKTYNTRYGYPYSYMAAYNTSKQIYIDHYAPCDFRIVLHGPQDNLNVTIGNVHLLVNHAIPETGYMVVDTRQDIPADKHCYLVAGGAETNCFNYRNPTTTLLEKVEPGRVKVTYNRRSRLDLTIYRERSEPAWI